MPSRICITGASGYLGRELGAHLLANRLEVRAVVRAGGASRVAAGVEVRELDVFDAVQLRSAFDAGDTVVHLIGTPHPNPSKAALFRSVDLASVQACAAAAAAAGVAHFIYVSVAQPAPVMHAYVAARQEAERAIAAVGLTATILRPWYVLGPGHRWPYLLLPFYGVASLLPGTRDTARRLGLVTLGQMTRALARAVTHAPPAGASRILEVPEIRAA